MVDTVNSVSAWNHLQFCEFCFFNEGEGKGDYTECMS